MSTLKCGNTSSPRAQNALQLIVRSPLAIERHTPWRLPRQIFQGASHSPRASSVLDDRLRRGLISVVRDSASICEPRWQFTLLPACRRFIFFHAGTFHVSSALGQRLRCNPLNAQHPRHLVAAIFSLHHHLRTHSHSRP